MGMGFEAGWLMLAGTLGAASAVGSLWGLVDLIRLPECRKDKVTLILSIVLGLNAALCIRVLWPAVV